MKFVLQPWRLFIVILANRIDRHQQEVIEYLRPRTKRVARNQTRRPDSPGRRRMENSWPRFVTTAGRNSIQKKLSCMCSCSTRTWGKRPTNHSRRPDTDNCDRNRLDIAASSGGEVHRRVKSFGQAVKPPRANCPARSPRIGSFDGTNPVIANRVKT